MKLSNENLKSILTLSLVTFLACSSSYFLGNLSKRTQKTVTPILRDKEEKVEDSDYETRFYYAVMDESKEEEYKVIFWVLVGPDKEAREMNSGMGIITHYGEGEKSAENEVFITSGTSYSKKQISEASSILTLKKSDCDLKNPPFDRGGLMMNSPIVFMENKIDAGKALLSLEVKGRTMMLVRDDDLWMKLALIAVPAQCNI